MCNSEIESIEKRLSPFTAYCLIWKRQFLSECLLHKHLSGVKAACAEPVPLSGHWGRLVSFTSHPSAGVWPYPPGHVLMFEQVRYLAGQAPAGKVTDGAGVAAVDLVQTLTLGKCVTTLQQFLLCVANLAVEV